MRRNDPWKLTLSNGLPILVPHSGSGALIYYQGFSETETAEFILRFLSPGMTFMDIGAHFGEYTLLTASIVGAGGYVHSFEPNPEIFTLLTENVRMSGLRNVRLHEAAVSDRKGAVRFRVPIEPALASLVPPSAPRHGAQQGDRDFDVDTVSLDHLLKRSARKIDLIKVDVEGAEMLVFRGASRLLDLPVDQAPVWIFEVSRKNYAAFGYRPEDLFSLLSAHAYRILRYSPRDGLTPITPEALPSGVTTNLIASKHLPVV